MSDFLAEDYRFTADLLREYAKRDAREMFRAVCSNNLNIILAALDLAEAVAPQDAAEEKDEPMSDVEQAAIQISRIRPILARLPPTVQGAILADLLATWLAGHIDNSSTQNTDALREELLSYHLATVRALVPVNAALIHGRSEP